MSANTSRQLSCNSTTGKITNHYPTVSHANPATGALNQRYETNLLFSYDHATIRDGIIAAGTFAPAPAPPINICPSLMPDRQRGHIIWPVENNGEN